MSAFTKLANITNKTNAFVIVVYTLSLTFLVAFGGYLNNPTIYVPAMFALGIPVNTIYSGMIKLPVTKQDIHFPITKQDLGVGDLKDKVE